MSGKRPAAGYVICTSPRSGSTLLCALMEATGRAGRPDSFYHEQHVMREWAEAWGLLDRASVSPDRAELAYLGAALAAGRGGTPVFGMRLQHAHLAPLAATLARLHPGLRSDAERLERAFGGLRYLHLTRANKVAQAVSLVIARQTGLWHRHPDGSERERTAPAAPPVYDRAAIAAEVAALTRADSDWAAWFARERIEPLRVTYEALAERPSETVRDLCAALGLDLPADAAIAPGVARLADRRSAAWAVRFRVGTR